MFVAVRVPALNQLLPRGRVMILWQNPMNLPEGLPVLRATIRTLRTIHRHQKNPELNRQMIALFQSSAPALPMPGDRP